MDITGSSELVTRINKLAALLPGLETLPGRSCSLWDGDLNIYVCSVDEFKIVRRHFAGLVKFDHRSVLGDGSYAFIYQIRTIDRAKLWINVDPVYQEGAMCRRELVETKEYPVYRIVCGVSESS